LLCARATQAITNHVSIGEYHLRFFPREKFSCSCRNYPIKSRHHILHECKRFNNYWNPNKASFDHFIAFLEYNSEAFSFNKGIT